MVTRLKDLHWTKAYKGPFLKKEAEHIAEQLKMVANPEINDIWEVKIRKRGIKRKNTCVCTASCGAGIGHNIMFDIYIKTSNKINQ